MLFLRYRWGIKRKLSTPITLYRLITIHKIHHRHGCSLFSSSYAAAFIIILFWGTLLRRKKKFGSFSRMEMRKGDIFGQVRLLFIHILLVIHVLLLFSKDWIYSSSFPTSFLFDGIPLLLALVVFTLFLHIIVVKLSSFRDCHRADYLLEFVSIFFIGNCYISWSPCPFKSSTANNSPARVRR